MSKETDTLVEHRPPSKGVRGFVPQLGIILLLHGALIGCEVALTSIGLRFLEFGGFSYVGILSLAISLLFGVSVTIFIYITYMAARTERNAIFGGGSYFLLVLMNFGVMALTLTGLVELA